MAKYELWQRVLFDIMRNEIKKQIKKQDMSIDDRLHLYGWLFTYNPYTKNWVAFTREDYMRVNNEPEENFLRSRSRDTLETLIIKCEGNVTEEKLKEILDKYV